MQMIAAMTETPALTLATSAPTLASMGSVVTNLLVGVFLLISIVMILLVLIQRPQGGGLSGAFGAGGGGGGAGQTAFGTKTGDVLTIATISIFVCFLVFAVILNFATRPQTANPTPPAISTPADNTGAAPLENEDAGQGEETDLSGVPDEGRSADQSAGDDLPPAPQGEPDAGDE